MKGASLMRWVFGNTRLAGTSWQLTLSDWLWEVGCAHTCTQYIYIYHMEPYIHITAWFVRDHLCRRSPSWGGPLANKGIGFADQIWYGAGMNMCFCPSRLQQARSFLKSRRAAGFLRSKDNVPAGQYGCPDSGSLLLVSSLYRDRMQDQTDQT